VVRPNEYDQGLSTRKAVYKAYAQAIPGAYAIEKMDKAPCRMACPANVNVQGYVQMIKEGNYKEAIEIILRDLPFPGVLGRVCPHACEKSCRRLEVDDAVAIRELKRFAADHVKLADIPIPEISPRKEKVAIVGSGPAGLSAAYFLARDGYSVTVYESMPEAGGMMRYGIPEHRLPRTVLDAEIENLKRYGIDIQTNTLLGRDLTLEDLKHHGADAIFIATGAWKGLKLRIPGEEGAKGVHDVTSFLREVNLGACDHLVGKVAVIGGGHSAIDGARVAKRLGAEEVHILYRRSRNEMPAEPEEVQAAEEEGITIHFLVSPLRTVTENGNVSGIECIRTRLTEPDTTGRRKPIPVGGSEFFIEADQLITAVGQEPDLQWLGKDHGLEVSKWNLMVVNPETLQTNRPGIFAGGDVISGPATVIEAVDAGKRAAKYMAMYMRGETLPTEWQEEAPIGTHWSDIAEDVTPEKRLQIPTLPVEKRLSGFQEVNLVVDESAARQEAERCLNCGGCCECYQCLEACKANAVTLQTHNQQQQTLNIHVGSVILAPGFKSFDPKGLDVYGYDSFPNVVTSMEFERILSATGPYQGRLCRPSDQSQPGKIAFIQCVGSRDINRSDHPYCSSVCCMYAIKEAVIAKEHAGKDLEIAIFYMDMRTHGKDFDIYCNRAKDEMGIRFIPSRIHTIDPAGPGSQDLKLAYVDEKGNVENEIFNMVVLSVGLEIPSNTRKLAEKIGVLLDSDGFAETSCFSPTATSRRGIFVCGAFSGPKDIPQSVMEASAASAGSLALLGDSRNSLIKEKNYPEEESVAGQEPRIGVFVCHCGINIGGVVNVPDVRDYAKTLPGVVYAEDNLFTCSEDTQQSIKEAVREHKLNRIVVAACTPRTHEPLFQETIREAGLNRYLFEFANIRDQDAWVHRDNPEHATRKAKDLVRMAVSKVALTEPLEHLRLDVTKAALVIGGGIAGMNAALNLAEQGFKTYLVERDGRLGGQGLNIRQSWKGEEVGVYLTDLQERVKSHKQIEVLLNGDIMDVTGFVGNFHTRVKVDGVERELKHGSTILATGAHPLKPDAYLYGQTDRVTIWHELEALFVKEPQRLEESKAVAFIQCVGSREPDRPYCSKVCCTASVMQAIALKSKKPDLDVTILYRDMRTYGQRESLYQRARELGVNFIRYSHDEEPVVDKIREDSKEKIRITVKDHILGIPLEIQVDYLNLYTAILPNDQETLAQYFKVPLTEEGFFLEAHAKLRPVDFSTDGVFVCGMAHYPKPLEESISQAQAAATRAANVLVKDFVDVEPTVSVVNQDKCIGCGFCEASCPFGAIQLIMVPGKGYRAENLSALCKGCGICAAGCPQKAIDMKHFRDLEIFAAIHAGGENALAVKPLPKRATGKKYISVSGYQMANDYYYHVGHGWVHLETGGRLKVGVDDFTVKVLGPAKTLEMPHRGTMLIQGHTALQWARKDNSANLLSPISGKIFDMNRHAMAHPEIINQDPYQEGWLFILEPMRLEPDLERLFTKEKSIHWMEEEFKKLLELLGPEYERLAATGGEPIKDLFGQFPALGWDSLIETFFKSKS
jgi:heterodisulfide reductase subunit A-like polyferredoxin/glycine cleavage system H lipoate-binding protein